MKQHFNEVDLLETYYTQPGESMPVMMHLADCTECAARYERLEKKVRGLAACEQHIPETFWSRQRAAIMRKIDARRSVSLARVTGVAAAAMFVLLLAGVIFTKVEPSMGWTVDENQTSTSNLALDESTIENVQDGSPWDSEELNEFHSMVAWESWVENGDQSL